ncbi:uncharacterized protein CLIB1444_04S03334 [[Candida] jaroonii]|uniref:Uncharacterized protein n=1 Tax=[Candida] jaroonii TaxID=467808 RepID=A0ACA9Y6M3_9ASCO|nr:uncharacterized protein CLIB1444_04S03334 [[Candida] jaroonii]
MNYWVYLLLGLLSLAYVGTVVLLNKSPHVKVKGIGFFCILGITFNDGNKVIRIKKLRLKINLFRGKDSPLKLLNLEIHDCQIKNLTGSKEKSVKGPEGPIDLDHILKFIIPKRVYDLIFYYQILNQFHIMMFRCSIHDEAIPDTILYFDYAKLENSLRYDGHNVLTLLLFNGFLHGFDDAERIQIFRNVEIILSCDAIFDCRIDGTMDVGIINFSLGLSLGRVHIPLDHLPLAGKKPKDTQTVHHPISKGKLELIRQIWGIIDSAKLTLEDFKITSGPYRLSLATFQTSLTHSKDSSSKSLSDWSLHIASLKIFEAETKCFELPSATINFQCNPFGIIQGLENTHSAEQISDAAEKSDVSLSIILTNPTIDIYHDQLMRLKIRKFRNTFNKKDTNTTINYMNFLLALNYVTTKIVIVDTKVTEHLPGFTSNNYRRDDANNLTIKCTVDSIIQRFATQDLSKMLLKKITKNQNLYGLFKIKNFKAELNDNIFYISKSNFLTTYNVQNNKVSLKLNIKKFKLKSVNDAIFLAFRNVKTRKILLENKLYSELIEQGIATVCPTTPTVDTSEYVELFNILPEIVNYVKVDIFEVQADIICKEGLPSQKFYDENSGKTIDLKDYGRGVSIKLGHITLNYKKDKEEVSSHVYNFQCFTLSELNLDYMDDFDVVAMYNNTQSDFSDVSSLESIALAERDEEDLKQVKKVFDLDEMEINNFTNKQRDKNRLSVKVSEINGRVDIFLVWCVVYAMTLLKNFSPDVERLCSKQQMNSMLGKNEKKLKLDVNINVIAIVTRLPRKIDVLCEFDTFNFRDVFETSTIEFKYFRSYVVHPKTKLWSRFLTMKESFVTVNALVEDNNLLDIVCSGMRLNIPHGFLFYTVFDNIVTFGKAIKQIFHNFENIRNKIYDFESIKPEAKGPFHMPPINLKSKILGITLENDPFENEISYILELGKYEQKIRLQKWKAFEKKSEEIMNNTIDSKIKLQENGSRSPNNTAFKFDKSKRSEPLLSDQEAHDKIAEARELLEAEMSCSWIHKFQKFRTTKLKNWKHRADRAWGEEIINDRITEKFDILNYLPGPLLLGAFFRNLDLSVKTSPIDDLDKFLHDFGKGQPKLDYSILVPLYLSIKSSGFFVFLRDYALPLISFPDNDNANKPSFQLDGNIVINEKMITRKEEMRLIWVPFSPPMAPDLTEDSFYSVLVPRTLTPVKFMTDINCKIDSDRAAMISYCKSYQAVLSAATSALDNFTKPPIDDSPLGWWDKVALLAHGRITFEIANELCFHMKSSTDPYDLTGRASGFVFCWKNNVVLAIDGNKKPSEIVTLNSDDFLLAIPNYSLAERKSWSLFYDEMADESSYDDDAESKKYQKRVMELSSDEKVQWTLGFSFERNKNDSVSLSDKEERTTLFRPHYDVFVTSPYYDYHPDSYEGYRSDYLHMAISVKSTSKKGNSSNTVHLTPLTFEYFFYWWHTITEETSLPVRQGPLFNSANSIDKSHVKMSSHLFTVKYQLIFDRLTISHLYLHSSGEGNKRITFTGLKARSSKVIIDLHQRKELLTYVNKKLNIENQIMHLKMNQAEISFEDTDIRLVNAIFADHSVQANLAKYLQGNSLTDSSSNDTEPSGNRYLGWVNGLDIHGDDFSWIDQSDFIELEQREVLSPYPKITVAPFCYSPKFTYVREFSLQEDGPYPFGREDVHDCQIGLEKPEDTQGSLLSDRLKIIQQELLANEELLKSLKTAPQDPSIKQEIIRVKKEIEITKDKQDLIQGVYEEITGKIAPGDDVSGTDDLAANTISRLNSRSLSVYSGHRSVDEANQVRLLNKEASEFHNRFIVHNLQFKWNDKLRDLFMIYMRLVGDRKSQTYYMSRKAVDLVETVLNCVPDEFEVPKLEESFCTECKAGEDVLNGFDDYLDDVNKEMEEAEHKFLIKLIHPQIQLVSEKDPESAALVVSKDLEMRVISVNVKDFSKLVSADNEVSGLIETRYGGIFNSSSMLVFRKSDSVISHPNTPYGYVDGQLAVDWPPWIECENIYDGSYMKDNVVTERNSMALTVRKPNYLYVDSGTSSQKDEIKVHIAKFVINADSRQYTTLFHVITDLLLHSKAEKNSLMNKLDKIMSLADNDDFYGLDVRVKELQESIREFQHLLLRLDIKSIKLDAREQRMANQLELEIAKRRLELSTIMSGLGLRNMKLSTNKRASKSWLISVDQIIWHLLDNSRAPFIDFALADAKFKRVDAMDGSNRNRVEVNMIQGFNLQEKAVYPELLSPIDEESRDKNTPIVLMTWRMLNSVGGIPIMQSAKLSIQPLKLQLDYETSKKLFEYMFPKEKKQKSKKTRVTSFDVSRSPDMRSSDISRSPDMRSSDVKSSDRSDIREDSRHSRQSRDMSDISSNDFMPIERPKNVFKNFINGSSKSSQSTPTDDEFDLSSSHSLKKITSTSTRFSSSEDVSLPPMDKIDSKAKESKDCKLPRRRPKKKTEEDEDDIALILSRSSKFFSIVDIEVEKVKLIISFKAPGHLNIIDVHNLSLNIPTLRYQNKTWSGEDFILRLRKDIIKVILQHTGQILGNKFKIRRRRLLKQPLKQIANYASFVSVQDLQGENNVTEEARRPNHHHHHHHHRRVEDTRRSSNHLQSFENMLQEIVDEEEEEEDEPESSTSTN